MKTIIFTWTNNCKNIDSVTTHYGIGDVLRGAMHTYELCKKHKYLFYLNAQLHPITNFLNHDYKETKDIVSKNKDNIHFIKREENLEQYILSSSEKEVCLMTNSHYKSVTEECKKYFVDFLSCLNDSFKEIYKKTLEELGLLVDYSIIHFRIGDNNLIRNNSTNLEEFDKIYERYHDRNELFMTDNIEFKNRINEKYRPKCMIFDKMAHFGYNGHNEILEKTFIEFLLIFNASKIKTYSVYPWISGFVFMPSVIKNIEILDLKTKPSKKVFCTFGGGNKNFYEAVKRISDQARETKLFDNIYGITDEDLKKDEVFWRKHNKFIKESLRGWGYWIWKPYIIYKRMEDLDNNDVLLYADSGCEIDIKKKDKIKKLIEDVKKENLIGSYPSKKHHPFLMEKKWNKMDVLKYFNIENDNDILNTNQRQASAIMIVKNDKTMSFLKEWYEICSNNYNLIDDSPSIEKNFEVFEQNRHDQSIFSILSKKHDIFSKMITIEDSIEIIRNRSGYTKI